jgi:hypothetical protein
VALWAILLELAASSVAKPVNDKATLPVATIFVPEWTSGQSHDQPPAFSPDGQTPPYLIFSSAKRREPAGHEHLFITFRQGIGGQSCRSVTKATTDGELIQEAQENLYGTTYFGGK